MTAVHPHGTASRLQEGAGGHPHGEAERVDRRRPPLLRSREHRRPPHRTAGKAGHGLLPLRPRLGGRTRRRPQGRRDRQRRAEGLSVGPSAGALSEERHEQLEDIDLACCPTWPVEWQRAFHLGRKHLEAGGEPPMSPEAQSCTKARTSGAGRARSASAGTTSPPCSTSSTRSADSATWSTNSRPRPRGHPRTRPLSSDFPQDLATERAIPATWGNLPLGL